jgi:biotin carboxyl carrier protein
VAGVVVALTRRVWPVACAVVALAGTSACDTASPATRAPHAQAQAHRQPTVADTSAMRVDTMTVTASRSYPSQVYVEHDVAVAAQASGVLDSVFVQLGSPVRGGALLALVDAGGQDIELARARERVERARAAVQRAQTLAKSGSTTTVESEQLAGELQQAELSVRAPRQLVAVGDTLFRVAETGPQLVRVRIAGPDGRHVRAGERAFVRETTGGASASGTVAFVAPALEPASGTREVIVRLGASRFLVGESVIVEMGSERRVAVVAPRAAIAADGYALVAQGDRTVMRSVTVGATLAGERVEILSGLAFGERLAPLRR